MRLGTITSRPNITDYAEVIEKFFEVRTSKVPFKSDPDYARRFRSYTIFYDGDSSEVYNMFIWPNDNFIRVSEEHGIEILYNVEFITSSRITTPNRICPYSGLRIVGITEVTFGVDLLYDDDTMMYLKLAL